MDVALVAQMAKHFCPHGGEEGTDIGIEIGVVAQHSKQRIVFIVKMARIFR